MGKAKQGQSLATRVTGGEVELFALRELDHTEIPVDMVEAGALVRVAVAGLRKSALVVSWNIGKLVQVTKERNEGRTHITEEIAEGAGCGARILREMHRFYQTYPEFSEIDHMELEWSAVRELLRVEDPEVRRQLQSKAQEDDLAVRDVRQLVNEVCKESPPSRKGDPPSEQPRSEVLQHYVKFLSSLQQMYNELAGILRKQPDMLVKLNNDEATPDEDFDLLTVADAQDGSPPVLTQLKRQAKMIMNLLEHHIVQWDFTPEDNDAEEEEAEVELGSSPSIEEAEG